MRKIVKRKQCFRYSDVDTLCVVSRHVLSVRPWILLSSQLTYCGYNICKCHRTTLWETNDNRTPWFFYMWKIIYYNNFPRLPLINIYVYISVKCMIYHFLHRTLHKVKNTHCFSRCNKARISWSRKRSLKQQLIQPIHGVVSSIMIRLYIWQGKQEKSTSGNPWSSFDC